MPDEQKRSKQRLHIEIEWESSVPMERRAEYAECVRREIRASADGDGTRAVRARVSGDADGLHWSVERLA